MDSLSYVYLFIIPLFFLLYWIHLSQVKKKLPRAPGFWIPFIGNLVNNELKTGDAHLLKDQRKLGSDAVTYSRAVLGKYHFIITSLDLAKECFIQNGDKSSHRIEIPKHSPLYKKEGIINASGNIWRSHRRTVVASLRNLGMGKNKLEGMIAEESRYLIEAMQELYAKSNDFPNRLLSIATTNIICQLAFGVRFNYLDASFLELYEAFKTQFSVPLFNFRRFLPEYITNLPGIYSKKHDDARKAFQFIRKFCGQQIIRYKKIMSSEEYSVPEMEDCVLEKLLLKQREDPEYFSDGCIQSMIQNLFSAGTDTSSTTLTWSILFLKNHPDIQELVRNEINEIIGNGTPKFQQLDSMPHLNAFMLETSRFCATAIRSLVHRLSDDIKTKDYVFPAGSLMQISIYCIQRDRQAFKNPDCFDINNFLDENKVLINDHLVPFSLGPRICPGDKLAKMEIFFFLVNIIRNFKMECLPGDLKEDDNAVQGITRMPVPYQVKMTAL